MILTALIAALGVLLLLPTVSDGVMAAQVLVRRVRGGSRGASRSRGTPMPHLLFLVPAHDEELLLGRCLDSLDALDYPDDLCDVTVIADNCTDGTAEVARDHGVRCLERRDRVRRGKPWALAWALEKLDLQSVDGVIILDADSRVDPGYARALARAKPLRGKAVQGYNDVSNADESSLTRMAAVFSAARCLGMNGLKQAAGRPVPLGNGFCLGTDVIRTHGWTAFSICEDWEMYALLTAAGVRIESQPEARVFSQEARSMGQSSDQRRRWAAGKIQVLLEQAVPILTSPKIGPGRKLDALAELLAPGPVVHFATAVGLAGLAWIASLPGAGLLAALLTVPLLRLGAYTALGIRAVERPGAALLAFMTLPPYAVWRMGVQASAILMTGRSTWVRTKRHDEARADVG